MQYFITFIEGIVSFLSPCVLPLLPVYISYFAAGSTNGDSESGSDNRSALLRSLFFVLGFTIVFVLMGTAAGTISSFMATHRRLLEIISGIMMVLFGFSAIGIIQLPEGKGVSRPVKNGLISSFLFGIVYSVSLSPCVGAFLGSALMLAGTSGTAAKGALLLTFYSIGFGLPFIITAVLIDKLGAAFIQIKKHMREIQIVSGSFLILMGILMISGYLGKWMVLLV